MGFIELLLIAVGLSMDAFAVSICKGIETKRATMKQILLCGVWFGVFQGMMPFLGWLLSSRFASVIDRFSAWVAFALLCFLGVNMLREAFSSEEEETGAGFGIKTMFTLAVATSVDAMAVGITFVAVPVQVLAASPLVNTAFGCLVICIVTFAFSSVGVRIGNIFGMRYKSGAEAVGGFVLLFIGLKILLEHLGVLGFMEKGDVLFGLLIPFVGTVLGSAMVFVVSREMERGLKSVLEGMAGGIMLACSMWTLLFPSVQEGKVLTAMTGFILGIFFQLLLDKTVPHTHVFTGDEDGPSRDLQFAHKVMLAELIHHVPEGMAVGVMFAGFLNNAGDVRFAAAMALAIGIAVQNIPEGAFVSLPLTGGGEEKNKAFLLGVLSGVVEPAMGIAVIIICGVFPGILPFMMALTGGALTFLVIEEVIPSMNADRHSDSGVVSFAVFFR